MKRWSLFTAPLLAVSLALTGCGKKEEAQLPQTPEREVQKEFEAARTTAASEMKAIAPAAEEEAATSVTQAAETASGEFGNLLNAFQSADPDKRSAVESAVESMRAGENADALKSLQALAAKGGLTTEQQRVLNDTVAQVQKQMVASTVEKAVASPEAAATDLKKALPLGK